MRTRNGTHRPRPVCAALLAALLLGGGACGKSGDAELSGAGGLDACPTLRPASPAMLADPAARRCRQALAAAGRDYALAVHDAKARCRDRIAAGDLSGDGRRLCHGLRALSSGAIRPPGDAETARLIGDAAARLEAALLEACPPPAAAAAGSCASRAADLAACVRADHWEHVEHLLDQTYGHGALLPDPAARRCQTTLAEAAASLTADSLAAMTECAVAESRSPGGDLAARCLGAVVDGFFTAPGDERTARRLDRAEALFAERTAMHCRDEELAVMDACRGDAINATACLRCVARREAILLAEGELGGVAPPATSALVDWEALRNPILGRDDRRIKDQVLAHADGEFVLLASQAFADDDAQGERQPLIFRSRDLREWRGEAERIRPEGDGVGSPDLTRDGGTWQLVFQDADPTAPDNRRLWLATATDLRSWSAPLDLAPGIFPGEPIIDGALGRAGRRHHLAFKLRLQQEPYVAGAARLAAGAWEAPQRMILQSEAIQGGFGEGWGENFQFIAIDGRPRLIATARDPEGLRCPNVYTCSHEPFIYSLAAAPATNRADWTHWERKTQLRVPYEAWNPVMHANTGFLNDWRDRDGYFYLTYSGSLDATSFQGRGHGKIGIARSRDLVHWRLAGDRRD